VREDHWPLRENGLHHAPRLRLPIYNQIGMKAAKGFSNVTIPTNWLMVGEYFRKLLWTQLSPLYRFVAWA
jgi:hypothetical protein